MAKQDVVNVDRIQKRIDKKKLRSMVSVVRADEKRQETIKNNEQRHSRIQVNRKHNLSPDHFLSQSLADWKLHQEEIRDR